MTGLWGFREKLRSIYASYDVFITPAIRFVFGFVVFHTLNSNLGAMARLNSVLVELVLSLVCCILPYGVMAFLAGLVLLAHVSSISLEMTMILFAALLIVAVIYNGIQPQDSYLLLLTPLFFHLRIPYAIPILAGLSCGLSSVVSVCCGTALFYIMQYIRQNMGNLSGEASLEAAEQLVQIARTLLSNRLMVVMIATCAVGFLAVYLVRRLPVNFSWAIAIVVGALAQTAAIFIGDFMFDVSVPMGQLLAGLVLSVLLAAVYHFFVFAVDYTRTEYVQFEDDDYYYYVKAVPKIAISLPDVKVQRYGGAKKRGPEEPDQHVGRV